MTGSVVRDPLHWRKSSFSAETNCVELAELPDGRIAVRDGHGSGDTFCVFTRAEMLAFLLGAKAGEFDYLT